MIGGILKLVAFVATTAVALPYTSALLCNLTYGWPQMKNKFRRAFSPKKVYALNFVLIQKMIISIRYIPLYMQWKAYYKMATAAEIMKDRSYGRNDQTLDLYFPRGHGVGDKGALPVVMFVYGGAWGSGDKKMYGLLCSVLANKLGVIVCCPNHSTYPQGYVDDMIQDLVDCMAWLYQNVEHYNGDKTKILLLGHSSGAHLCAMAMLELLHDEIVNNPDYRPVTASSIQFSEQHFDGRFEGDNNEDRQSSGSSGSFCVVDGKNDNGSQSNDQATSRFEILSTQQSESELSEGSLMESDIQDLSNTGYEGLRYRGAGSPEEKVGSDGERPSETMAAGGVEEEDDSGDNDSIVTVKNKGETEGSGTQPSLNELSKCVKAIIGLSGVYHIGDHFLHESKRGVEDVSTMARSMYGAEHFDRFSPSHILSTLNPPLRFPKVCLLHGTDDYVVPLSSTTKFSEQLKRVGVDVTVRIIPSCDHYEICLDLMKQDRKFYTPVLTLIEDVAKEVFT